MAEQIVICRSNPIAPDPRVEKIARALSGDGYQVTGVGWDRTAQLPKEEQLDGLRVFRLHIAARYGSGLMNLPALLIWQLGLLWWLIRHRHDYQVIHACDFDTILPALFCKWLWKKTVVYDIFDFYADHLRRTPRLLKQAIRAIDYWAIHQADGVILVDEARVEQIRGSHPKMLVSIYNSPEDVPLDSVQTASPSVVGELRITYVGLLQIERGLFEMIEVLGRHPSWHLDLAGFGGDEQQIVSIIQNMPNVTWHGRIAYDRALALSQQADVLFATYDPVIPNHRYSSPNKIFEGMMLAKPLIVAEQTNMDRIIQDAQCGIIVKYGDKTALENALRLLADDPNLRETLGQNARRAYTNIYSWEKMQNRLQDFYRQILAKRRA